jgi:hypothetical protein
MDGQDEVVNKWLETYLSCFSCKRKNQWSKWLLLIEWSYNTSYHKATRMTPFEALYGQNLSSILSYMLGVLKVQKFEKNITV